ncbi:MAG TPA: hypothetical protein VH374_08250 [Polyangia bacterium]|jgi:hypothetical protein|nr:hypothetical protein [Polyangia bacterium]
MTLGWLALARTKATSSMGELTASPNAVPRPARRLAAWATAPSAPALALAEAALLAGGVGAAAASGDIDRPDLAGACASADARRIRLTVLVKRWDGNAVDQYLELVGRRTISQCQPGVGQARRGTGCPG